MAAAVPAPGGVADHRDLDPAPSARRAAAAPAVPPETELGGPGTARDPARRDPESAAPGAAAAGHPGHHAPLAPRHRPPPLGRQVHPRQDRPAGDPQEHQDPGPPAGPGEPRMGIPQDPRGTGRPRNDDSRLNGLGDSQEGRNRPCAAPIRAYLAAVPAFPGRGDPGVRLLHRRPARRHPGPCPGRHRARHQAHPHPRSHPAPNRRMDRPASPQPDHGPRRAGTPGQVHDPRPRLELSRPRSTRSSPVPGSGPCSATCGPRA